MKKMLLISNTTGGLFLFRKNLVERLSLDYSLFGLAADTGKKKELEALGLHLKEISIDRRGMNPISDIFLFVSLRKLIRTINPSFVLTYTIKPNIYAGFLCGMFNLPYAANITGLGTAFEKGILLKKIVEIAYKLSLRKAKVVFFENDSDRQLFIHKHIIPENRTCLLMGAGVDLDKFFYQPYPYNESFRFIFIGRIMREKGIDELFEAMSRFYQEGRRIILDVCGKVDEAVKEKIDKYTEIGWLQYHGCQDDVRPYIGRADCLVLPSYHEGMANVNLECAASGRPIITTNIPGCKEAVKSEVSGFLCEPKSVESLYAAMKRMIETSREEREEMGKAGRKHMEEVFDKRKVVAETIKRIGEV